jgi:50S ribosomal protein L16 3-hydroxylase
MTYSVGFRAPSQADLLEELLGHLIELPSAQQRFADPKRMPQPDPTIISEQDLERLTDFVMNALPQRETVKSWLKDNFAQEYCDED